MENHSPDCGPVIGYIRQYSSRAAFFIRFIEAIIVLGSLHISSFLCSGVHDPGVLQVSTVGLLGLYVFGDVKGIYGSWRINSAVSELWLVSVAWGGAFGVALMVVCLVTTSAVFSYLSLFLWFFITLVSLIGARTAARMLFGVLRRRGEHVRSAAIVGVNQRALKLFAALNAMPWLGLAVKGYYDDDFSMVPATDKSLVLGGLSRLVEDAREGKVSVVYVALPEQAKETIVELLCRLADTTASVYLLPDSFVLEMESARWLNLSGIPVVGVQETPFTSMGGCIKRIEDILLSATILVLAALPMLLIALAVRLTSRGPIIFSQRRYGLDGRAVYVWKFRSMTVCQDGYHIPQAKRLDSRVTPLGHFLRRTSLDELPQFFNVLLGTMSVVGPRPHAVAHNEHYRHLIHGYMVRHKVKPGITGWAQVNGWRGETNTVEKMQRRVDYDLYYIQNWSLWLDARIVWLTILRGFSGQNVY